MEEFKLAYMTDHETAHVTVLECHKDFPELSVYPTDYNLVCNYFYSEEFNFL